MAGSTGPANHLVQFHESEPALHRSIAAFFTEGAGPADRLIMISRPRTFEAVKQYFTASANAAAKETADRIQFVNAETTAVEFVGRGPVDQEHLQRAVTQLLEDLCRDSVGRMVRIYGETVDLLCEQGHSSTAARIEEFCDGFTSRRPGISVFCGYAAQRFANGRDTSELRAICRHHAQVIPRPSVLATTDPGTKTVYVIEDDPSIRRTMVRLLTAAGWPVRTFASAEEFLLRVDQTVRGCLLVDIQLGGMSGLELHDLLACDRWSLPLIAMSGAMERSVEADALRLGARAFLRKPFDGEALLDAIERALA
jgi:CheY-like chemotaxis protein